MATAIAARDDLQPAIHAHTTDANAALGVAHRAANIFLHEVYDERGGLEVTWASVLRLALSTIKLCAEAEFIPSLVVLLYFGNCTALLRKLNRYKVVSNIIA